MKHLLTAAAAALSLFIAGCGGGGGGSTSTNSSTGSLTVSGVAATGAAMTHVTVTAKCASGTGTVTQPSTNTNGSYSVTITNGTLPCVLEATGKDSNNNTVTLHSVTTSTTANITPLTELLVAQLTGTDPSTYMSNLDTSTLASIVTSSIISSAQSAVLTVLSNAGISTSSISDIVSDSIDAGSGSNYDGVLDELAAKLANVNSDPVAALSTLTRTVASTAAGSSSSSTTSSDTASLPADLLLKPHASNCDALRSTTYRAVMSRRHGSNAVAHFSVDAATLIVTDLGDNGTETWTANGTCRFTSSDGHDIVVSPAGVVVARSAATGSDPANTYHLLVAVPEQTHTLADQAGNWNVIGLDTDDSASTWFAYLGTSTVTASGEGTVSYGCEYASTTATRACASSTTPHITYAVDERGGFLGTATSGNYVERNFVYRAGNGALFLINANQSTNDVPTGDGSISFGTKQRTLTLPTVNTVNSVWNVSINTLDQLSGNAIDSVTHTITSVDSSAGSFTRQSGTTSGATHSETISINSIGDGTALNGFSFRDGATGVATSDNSTTTVRKSISFKAPGMGLSVNYLPVMNGSAAKLTISVAQ
jgi:hypothetical protein